MSDLDNIFSFEFHSLIPASDCKTISDAKQSTTLRLFGRTKTFKSVCVNILAHFPYFYLRPNGAEFNIQSPFGNDQILSEIGINVSSFKISVIEKKPFYHYYEGIQTFLKVECCSETVRKRLINFVKDSPNLNYTLYEAHISFALQFMSDFGLVGMGLVHIKSPFFVQDSEKSSTCNIECSIQTTDIMNNIFIAQNNKSHSLLPSLALFMENLGISDFRDQSIHQNNYVSDTNISANLDFLWPNENIQASDNYKSKAKCPSFKNYLFRHSPPLEITNYIPLHIPLTLKCSNFVSRRCRNYYTPAHDPPSWHDVSSIVDTKVEDQKNLMIEKLTIESTSKKLFPLFEFGGEFYLKCFALECYENSFTELSPISAITFSIFCGQHTETQVFSTVKYSGSACKNFIMKFFESESDMLQELLRVVIYEDPDVLIGFEIDNRSWGYIAERFNFLKNSSDISFQSEISRIISKSKHSYQIDPWISRASSQFQVQGRIALNLWRIYRDEIALRTYSLSDIYKHYFQKDIPYISTQSLLALIQLDFSAFLRHAMLILNCVCDLTTKTPFLIKAIEFSRLFGIDLFSTLTRGSQYRVESILITAAHSEDYLLLTPTESDVRRMRAAQGLPLTMEPVSNYYRDPVVILDFQSLYPSMIIAHNFCYSTVIGTVINDLVISCGTIPELSPKLFNWESFSELSNQSTFKAPGDISFIRKEQKVGLLPRLLFEILSTRITIKNAMKSCDPKIKNVLDARQLALKYISNVTYGYTSASFSGRMPNVDIADAIVLSGRKTLERAVDVIESHTNWEAKVIYGDTDSLFVLLPGRSLKDAFRIGKEMADLVSSNSPHPVALKFEKVYFPSVLMSKKRYCGYKYEYENSNPVFDAKGIETVRRDGCNLVSKVLKKSLMLLFLHNDEILVKEYLQRQLVKILTYQKFNAADFVFAREVRFGTYKSDEENRLPLSAIAAKKRQSRNPRDVISFGQRVPFVIVSKPFSKLHQQVVDLDDFLSKDYKIDVIYYATKQVLSALSRVFIIQGIDVWKWYNELPLAQIKHLCNPRNSNVFRGPFINIDNLSKSFDGGNLCDYKQDALKLQNLINQDFETKNAKRQCCGNQECMTWSCKAFWDRFNFEHQHKHDLINLKMQFNIDF